MDILNVIRNDPGALVVGAGWAVYVVANQIHDRMRNTRQQAQVDKGNHTLLEGLQKSLNESNVNGREERDRADRLAKVVQELSSEIGGLRSDLKHSEADRAELRQEVLKLTDTVDTLVSENRNKDKSITQLVDLNRKILRSIGSNADALSIEVSDAQEKTDGNQD